MHFISRIHQFPPQTKQQEISVTHTRKHAKKVEKLTMATSVLRLKEENKKWQTQQTALPTI